jgi:hypothetical protein
MAIDDYTVPFGRLIGVRQPDVGVVDRMVRVSSPL